MVAFVPACPSSADPFFRIVKADPCGVAGSLSFTVQKVYLDYVTERVCAGLPRYFTDHREPKGSIHEDAYLLYRRMRFMLYATTWVPDLRLFVVPAKLRGRLCFFC